MVPQKQSEASLTESAEAYTLRVRRQGASRSLSSLSSCDVLWVD